MGDMVDIVVVVVVSSIQVRVQLSSRSLPAASLGDSRFSADTSRYHSALLAIVLILIIIVIVTVTFITIVGLKQSINLFFSFSFSLSLLFSFPFHSSDGPLISLARRGYSFYSLEMQTLQSSLGPTVSPVIDREREREYVRASLERRRRRSLADTLSLTQ